MYTIYKNIDIVFVTFDIPSYPFSVKTKDIEKRLMYSCITNFCWTLGIKSCTIWNIRCNVELNITIFYLKIN